MYSIVGTVKIQNQQVRKKTSLLFRPHDEIFGLGFEGRDRLDDLICGHNGAGVVWHINVESGVHMVFRVIRGRVFYHRDVVAELSGKANRRFDAGMCDEPDNDELMMPCFLSCKSKSVLAKPLEHQCFASATPLMRSHILPPSEMKSLYGSTTRSAMISLSYVSFVFVICQFCHALSNNRIGIRKGFGSWH